MKERIKKFLRKKGWYYYLRYSFLFRLYSSVFKRKLRDEHQREVQFYRSFLPHCNLIFDIGANDGHKTLAFLDLAKKVVSVEPDEENFKLLNIRFRNNKRVLPERRAVSDKTGTATMHVHHAASAFNTLSPKWKKLLEDHGNTRWNEEILFTGTSEIRTTTLDELISIHGIPDFIKVDVEGYEPWVLRGLSQRIKYISFETLLPEYMAECRDCIDQILRLDREARFNVAKNEQLLLPEFCTSDQLASWINQNEHANTVEIIVSMNTTA